MMGRERNLQIEGYTGKVCDIHQQRTQDIYLKEKQFGGRKY